MEQGGSVGTFGFALLIAFGYGVFHTLGPGYGKAVVISYFIGTGGSLRRGVVVGAKIAAMHVLSAVVVVFPLDFAVRQATGAAQSDYRMIRLGSYALIVAIGAAMLWRALAALRTQRATAAKNGSEHCHHNEQGHSHHHHDAHAHAGYVACAERRLRFESGARIAAAACVLAIGTSLFATALAQTASPKKQQQASVGGGTLFQPREAALTRVERQ